MVEIIPAVIPQNLNIVMERFEKVRGLARRVQMDVVDGHYAPPTTWPFNKGQMDELLKMVRGEERFPLINEFEFQVDMLVLHPAEYIPDFLSIGFKSFVIHIDSTDHMQVCVETIKNAGCEVGLGIKPSGDMQTLLQFLPQVDFVQFMGNDKVGYNQVELDEKVLPKIATFHKMHPSVPIQIDIGVNFDTASKLIAAGCTRLISGSAIFNSPNIAEAIERLKNPPIPENKSFLEMEIKL